MSKPMPSRGRRGPVVRLICCARVRGVVELHPAREAERPDPAADRIFGPRDYLPARDEWTSLVPIFGTKNAGSMAMECPDCGSRHFLPYSVARRMVTDLRDASESAAPTVDVPCEAVCSTRHREGLGA